MYKKKIIDNNGIRREESCLKDENAGAIDRSTLKDIKDVIIDTSKPCTERIQSYIEQIGDPYCYMDDGVVVQIGYAETPVSLQERLVSYASNMGRGAGNLSQISLSH